MIRSAVHASRCVRQATLEFRCFTTAAAPTATAATEPAPPDDGGPAVDAVFPWRSSPELLERLQRPDDLSGVSSRSWWNRNARQALVARQLNYSWPATALGTWKNDLSKDMAWAFGKALSGLLSHVLKIPVDVIDKDDALISVDTSTMDTIPPADWTEEASQEAQAYVDQVLEEKLRSQYAPVDTSTYDLKLTMAPISCNLEHAFVIPVITRDAVAKDPSLLDLYHDLDEAILKSTASIEQIKDRVEALIEKSGGTPQTFTLIVDTSVECLEQFSVTNKATGALVQGRNGREEVVHHLVRFEMTLTEKDALTSWRLVDWDDALGGNVWHVRRPKEGTEHEKESGGAERDDEPSP